MPAKGDGVKAEADFEALRAVTRARILESHVDGLDLAGRLANQAVRELSDLSGLESDSLTQFRMVVLGQSINSCWAALELIETGFARQAVFLFRLMREGHIAVLWSKKEPAKASELFEKVRDTPALQRGSWPSAGHMAKDLSNALRAEGSDKAWGWNLAMRAMGDTQNEVFTHALSDFALAFGFEDDGRFAPVLGPHYIEQLTEIAINHLIALMTFVLNDAIRLAVDLDKREIAGDADALLEEASMWMRRHPLPVLTGGDDALIFGPEGIPAEHWQTRPS